MAESVTMRSQTQTSGFLVLIFHAILRNDSSEITFKHLQQNGIPERKDKFK